MVGLTITAVPHGAILQRGEYIDSYAVYCLRLDPNRFVVCFAPRNLLRFLVPFTARHLLMQMLKSFSVLATPLQAHGRGTFKCVYPARVSHIPFYVVLRTHNIPQSPKLPVLTDAVTMIWILRFPPSEILRGKLDDTATLTFDKTYKHNLPHEYTCFVLVSPRQIIYCPRQPFLFLD